MSIAYGSEKKVWLEEQARAFDATRPTTTAGRCITLDLKAMGSGEVTQGILQGTLQPTVYSPASTAYLTLLNAAWVDKTGKPDALAPPGQTLVLSPVVIAMWKPMAEALGWPKKNLAWKDLLKVAQDPKGWAGLGHPEWGQFKLGHTQPEYSNSGLLAVLAVAYAGKGTTRGLTSADLDLPAVQAEIAAVERPIVHYGKSTGFFADKLISRGPGYLSAAVLYESNVVEAYAKNPALPLVALYPQEGTFWSDHPFSVLEAPWNGPEAREAAKLTLLVFDDQVAPPAGPFKMATQRGEAKARIQALFASGGTSLYDATRAAYQLGLERAKTERDRIHAVVVMTDGQDESSKLPLEQLRSGLAAEDRAVRVFTIAYGNAADTKILDGIAEAVQGTSAKGTQANIVSVFQDIGAFF